MYVNKCTKCGAEFETKNPKRVICPNCLYPEKKLDEDTAGQDTEPKMYPRSYSAGSDEGNGYNKPYQHNPNYNRDNRNQGHYQNNNYRQNNNRQSQGGGFNRRPNGGFNRQNQYNNGGNRPQQNRFNKPGQRGNFNRKPNRKPNSQKPLLVSKEQLAQIEELYKKVLPLPSPDIHEVIGQAIGLEPRKVFFGINLIRQKMFLPKQPFPKRKLAVSAEQLSAIKMLYEPLLPLPPIGCHKIIAIQLKMDEWRVHVGIGIVRKQMGLERWNEGRPDAPPQVQKAARAQAEKAPETPEEEKPKRGRKKKTTEEPEQATAVTESTETAEEQPKKRTRKKKSESEE